MTAHRWLGSCLLVVALSARLLADGQATCKDNSLDQGWDCQMQWNFWYTPQGTRIIPYEWLASLALERKLAPPIKMTDALNRDYGYIPMPITPAWVQNNRLNPDHLPIGFVVDGEPKKPYLGISCAACHTAQIKLGGEWLIVNGGPSNGDLFALVNDLAESINQTRQDPARLQAFAAEVLKKTGGKQQDLIDEMDSELKLLNARIARNRPKYPNGWGRLDAFGQIFNQVVERNPNVADPANAPVSFPFLWHSPKMSKVQWTGSSSQHPKAAHALLRNMGEALGAFGRFSSQKGESGLGQWSSLRIKDMRNLEAWVQKLQPPKLPDSYVETSKLEQGKAAYKKAMCARCHPTVSRTDLASTIHVTTPKVVIPQREGDGRKMWVGTEALTATELDRRQRSKGKLRLEYEVNSASINQPLLPGKLVVGGAIINAGIGAFVRRDFIDVLTHPFANLIVLIEDLVNTPARYKAGPLNGIWATAPYLHNGSVASLAELLNINERRGKFCLSGREFDAKIAGFNDDSNCRSTLETNVDGNKNYGHNFGNDLNKDEKKALLEYVKSL